MRTQSSIQAAYVAPPPLPPGLSGANVQDKKNPEVLWADRLRRLGVTGAMGCGVIFGSPRLDCAGTGICKLDTAVRPPENGRKGRCRASRGFIATFDNGRSTALILPEAFLCARVWRNHLSAGILVMETPCPIPAIMTKKLRLKIKALPAGIYPLHRANEFVLIQF